MTNILPIAQQPWHQARETRAVMQALADARFVGGCVRNALLGLKVDDIDIATPLTPNEVAACVESRGMRAVATGIEHGTMTVICNSKPFEVTTLRRDVSTDGRRASVAFTKSWEEDAARRDFTINALYADMQGNVYDYASGIDDLKGRRVRFIGVADQRIAEDHLRILRLFRIHAWYGQGELDRVALAACVSARSKLNSLSGERIQREMFKLFAARDPGQIVRVMTDSGVLAELVPGALLLSRFESLCAIDLAHGFEADAQLRACSLLTELSQAQHISGRWRLSNEDRDRLVSIFAAPVRLMPDLPANAVRRLLYRHGPSAFSDCVRLRWASETENAKTKVWRELLLQAERWQRPKFPLAGSDVMATGISQGPGVGRVLKQVEDWWVENDFPEDRALVMERLKLAAGSAKS
ncbi:MAG: CCA tRNA nucleotidyltransferase [Micropepsaceae bacterium]